MTRQFRYPKVTEIRAERDLGAARPAPAQFRPRSQRELVEASLLRCPGPQHPGRLARAGGSA